MFPGPPAQQGWPPGLCLRLAGPQACCRRPSLLDCGPFHQSWITLSREFGDSHSLERFPEAVLSVCSWQAMPFVGNVQRCPMKTRLLSVKAHAARRAHEELAQEHAKARRWHDENIRRKTNYIPLLFNLLRMLAEKRQLQPLMQAARDSVADKQRQA